MSCGGNGNSAYVQQILNRCSISNGGKNLVNNFNSRITNLENSDIEGPAGPPGPQGPPGADGEDVTARKYVDKDTFDNDITDNIGNIDYKKLFRFDSDYLCDIVVSGGLKLFPNLDTQNTNNSLYDNNDINTQYMRFVSFYNIGSTFDILNITNNSSLVTLQQNEYVKVGYILNNSNNKYELRIFKSI
jgi:hypothetical protein